MEHSLEYFIGSELHMNMLLLIGLALFMGTIGARIFQKLHIPQVVGYIITGLLVGEVGFGLLSSDIISQLKPINYFALGIIGFMIGGELRTEVFKKYGKQFMTMVIAEGLGAFILVAPSIALIYWLFTADSTTAIVVGLVVGAISSATDPASTMQVFWEYRTRGVLTTAITAIVALDDALALALYAAATAVAGIIAGGSEFSIVHSVYHLGYELFGAVALGCLIGLLLSYTYIFLKNQERLLPYTIGLILLVIGLSQALKLDIILASMAFGVTLANVVPRRSHETFDLIKKFAPPIYVLFFVFVGARLDIHAVSLLMGLLILGYILARSCGKIVGIYYAARISGAPQRVRKYAGFCLFTQAGVAVGLSIMASQHFAANVGDLIITLITATTFIVQIIGPAFVKMAIKNAGEIDLNITEEDLIASYTVKDIMQGDVNVLTQTVFVSQILEKFSEAKEPVYYITDQNNILLGCVSLEGIRSTLATGFVNDMLIADDVMSEIEEVIYPEMPLAECIDLMRNKNYDYLPVVSERESRRLVGMVSYRNIKRILSGELIKRRQLAETH